MPTLQDLMEKFGSAPQEDTVGGAPSKPAVEGNGATKLASGGNDMGHQQQSLTDIYMALSGADMQKQAAAAAHVPAQDEVDFAKMAADLAGAEAESIIASDDQGDIIKIAQEYDSAGRIMARGFYDEFRKLAGAMDTDVTPNQNAEPTFRGSTPSIGERGNPTVPTNYAGSVKHDQKLETTGPGPKQVYKDSLQTSKKIKAGVTGDDPEAAALSLGSGSPAGFATIKDLR